MVDVAWRTSGLVDVVLVVVVEGGVVVHDDDGSLLEHDVLRERLDGTALDDDGTKASVASVSHAMMKRM